MEKDRKAPRQRPTRWYLKGAASSRERFKYLYTRYGSVKAWKQPRRVQRFA